jgi:phosphoheptose isomerase
VLTHHREGLAFAFQKDTSAASAIAFDFAFNSLFKLLKSF